MNDCILIHNFLTNMFIYILSTRFVGQSISAALHNVIKTLFCDTLALLNNCSSCV